MSAKTYIGSCSFIAAKIVVQPIRTTKTIQVCHDSFTKTINWHHQKLWSTIKFIFKIIVVSQLFSMKNWHTCPLIIVFVPEDFKCYNKYPGLLSFAVQWSKKKHVKSGLSTILSLIIHTTMNDSRLLQLFSLWNSCSWSIVTPKEAIDDSLPKYLIQRSRVLCNQVFKVICS